MIKQILVNVLPLAIFVGCAGGGSSGAGAATGGVPAKSLWMQKNEAEELRSTGRLDSLCPELRKSPGRHILNVRLVDDDGSFYAYSPAVGKTDSLRLGAIGSDGSLVPSPMLRQSIGNMPVRVEAQGEVLSVLFGTGSNPMRMSYLRSSEDEIRRYFEAQERCR